MMLSLGAAVVAVEPAQDLANAVAESALLNCWSDRLTVLNAFAGIPPVHDTPKPVRGGYRAGGVPATLRLPPATVVPLSDILISRELHRRAELYKPGVSTGRPRGVSGPPLRRGASIYELVKVDVDGDEGSWLEHIVQLMDKGRLYIRTLVIECHRCGAIALKHLQQALGYTVYQLDMHVDRRFIDARGFDVYENRRVKADPLPRFVEELYSIRLMRHLYRFRRNMTLYQWSLAHSFRRSFCNQYVFTHTELLEPRREHPSVRRKPPWIRKVSGWVAPADGIGDPEVRLG
eukprot:3068800-Prymnesium_polylepis.1